VKLKSGRSQLRLRTSSHLEEGGLEGRKGVRVFENRGFGEPRLVRREGISHLVRLERERGSDKLVINQDSYKKELRTAAQEGLGKW